MNNIIENFENIKSNIRSKGFNEQSIIVAISKTFDLNHIKPLIDLGHKHFGENKVQEAEQKWGEVKPSSNIKLHMVGKLQKNKAKKAVEIFDYIHSLDNPKLADALFKHEKNINKKVNYFIQVNLGNEIQKSGIGINEIDSFYNYCSKDLSLNILGLMAIPPNDGNEEKHFKTISDLNSNLELPELSLGMSGDYLLALKYKASFLRIGSKIFGERSKQL